MTEYLQCCAMDEAKGHSVDCPAQPDLVSHPPHYETNGPPCAGCGRTIQAIEIRENWTANLSDALSTAFISSRSGMMP